MNDEHPSERDNIPPDEINAIFRRLRQLKASFGRKPNMDRVGVALIGACITEGFDRSDRIIGALVKLALNRMHVGQLLRRHDEDGAGPPYWRLEADGRYRLLDAALAAS